MDSELLLKFIGCFPDYRFGIVAYAFPLFLDNLFETASGGGRGWGCVCGRRPPRLGALCRLSLLGRGHTALVIHYCSSPKYHKTGAVLLNLKDDVSIYPTDQLLCKRKKGERLYYP